MSSLYFDRVRDTRECFFVDEEILTEGFFGFYRFHGSYHSQKCLFFQFCLIFLYKKDISSLLGRVSFPFLILSVPNSPIEIPLSFDMYPFFHIICSLFVK